jgi:hypothetical protein
VNLLEGARLLQAMDFRIDKRRLAEEPEEEQVEVS